MIRAAIDMKAMRDAESWSLRILYVANSVIHKRSTHDSVVSLHCKVAANNSVSFSLAVPWTNIISTWS